MTSETFTQCFNWLEKFHGKQVAAVVRQKWLDAFGKEHDDIFCKAMILHDERTRPGLFPTIEQMRKFIADAREKAWQTKKAAEPKHPFTRPEFPRDHRDVERGRQWLAGILAVSEGKKDADQLIAEMAQSPRREQ